MVGGTQELCETSHLMSSSVTTKALQRGCDVLSHTPGFFSTAAVSCPVTGAGLVCRALAKAESSILSEHAGPTPKHGENREAWVKPLKERKKRKKKLQLWFTQGCHIFRLTSPCKPLGSSIVFTSSSAISNAFNPLNFLSQNSWRVKNQNQSYFNAPPTQLQCTSLSIQNPNNRLQDFQGNLMQVYIWFWDWGTENQQTLWLSV